MLRIALLSVCKYSGAKVTPVLACVCCWSLIVTGPDLLTRGPNRCASVTDPPTPRICIMTSSDFSLRCKPGALIKWSNHQVVDTELLFECRLQFSPRQPAPPTTRPTARSANDPVDRWVSKVYRDATFGKGRPQLFSEHPGRTGKYTLCAAVFSILLLCVLLCVYAQESAVSEAHRISQDAVNC